MSEHQWEVIAELNGLLDAQALLGRLEAEGIPAQTEQVGPKSAFPLTVGRLGMLRIYVPVELAEQALAIAEYDYSDELAELAEDDSLWDDEGEDVYGWEGVTRPCNLTAPLQNGNTAVGKTCFLL